MLHFFSKNKFHVKKGNYFLATFFKLILPFQFDSDGTGSIDFPEFLALIAKLQKEALDDVDEVREAVTVFDKDGTGFLSKERVKSILEDMGEPMNELELKQMMESFHFDNEGKISVEKFVAITFNEK